MFTLACPPNGLVLRVEGGAQTPCTWSVQFQRNGRSPIGGLMTMVKRESTKVSFVGFADRNSFAGTTILRNGEPQNPFYCVYLRM